MVWSAKSVSQAVCNFRLLRVSNFCEHRTKADFEHNLIVGWGEHAGVVDKSGSRAYCVSVDSELNFLSVEYRYQLEKKGVFIVETPSIESQQYDASEGSKAGHNCCKTGQKLSIFCKLHVKNVFMFGMNDEVLHTVFVPMCQYLFAMCVRRN